MKLRPLKTKDTAGMLEWMHDESINKNFRFDASKQTKESVLNFIESSLTDYNKHFAIADENDEYLGTISLKQIDYENRTAEYAICLRSGFHGKGIAAWATKEIFKIAFLELGLNRIYLNVLSENVKAQRLYEKIGFIYEGESVDHICLKGEYKSLKWYAILKNQYLENCYEKC